MLVLFVIASSRDWNVPPIFSATVLILCDERSPEKDDIAVIPIIAIILTTMRSSTRVNARWEWDNQYFMRIITKNYGWGMRKLYEKGRRMQEKTGIFHFRNIIKYIIQLNILSMKKRFRKILINKGFTLIEVLIASLILSSVFFAILSMISNNSRQTVNLNASSMMDGLFPSSKACIQSFGYTYLASITGTQSLNFGTDNLGCATGDYDSDLTFTGITLARDTDTETGSLTFWNYFSQTWSENGITITNYLSDGKDIKKYEFKVTP